MLETNIVFNTMDALWFLFNLFTGLLLLMIGVNQFDKYCIKHNIEFHD